MPVVFGVSVQLGMTLAYSSQVVRKLAILALAPVTVINVEFCAVDPALITENEA